jgi:hypothetical protein
VATVDQRKQQQADEGDHSDAELWGERREIDNYDPLASTVGEQPDYHANENQYVGTDPIYQNFADETHAPTGVVAPYETNAPEGVLTAFEEYHEVEVVEREDNVVDQEQQRRGSDRRGEADQQKSPRPARRQQGEKPQAQSE